MLVLEMSLHGIFFPGVRADAALALCLIVDVISADEGDEDDEMSSAMRYCSSIALALSEWMASNSSVQSEPALMRMLSVPPGWSLRNLVQS